MSSPPESKDELQPLRRSTRKSVAAKTEETVVTPRKRKSTATPLKNVPEKTEVVGTPRRTRAAATPRKSLAENISTPKKNGSNVHTEETPKKKQRTSPNNSNAVDNSPISKRIPRKSRAKEDLKQTADDDEDEETSKAADEELNTNRRGRRKSVVSNPGRKKNEKSVETTIEENTQESGITPLTEESTNQKQDFEGDLPISISTKKKSRKSVHFKSDIDEHQIESDDSPPSNLDPLETNVPHTAIIKESKCTSSLALAPKAVMHNLKEEIREANPAEMYIEGSITVNEPNTLPEAVCFADIPEGTENYSAMESQLDKTLLSPKHFLNSDEDESDSGTFSKISDRNNSSKISSITNEMDHIKNKLTENISRADDGVDFKSPRRKLSYENKKELDNEGDKIEEQEVLTRIENPDDQNTKSCEKSEILLSPQKENISEIINQNISIPEIPLNSTKDENNLPTKEGEDFLPNKTSEIQIVNESFDNTKEIVSTTSSDEITEEGKPIMTNVEENACEKSVAVITSPNRSQEGSLKEIKDSGEILVVDPHKSDSTYLLKEAGSSNVTEEENLITLSPSSDHSNSGLDTINSEAKNDEVIPTSQNCKSNPGIGSDAQIVESELDLRAPEVSKNEQDQEQKNIDQISLSSSNSLHSENEFQKPEYQNLPDDENECDSRMSSSVVDLEIVSSNNVDSFQDKSEKEKTNTSDLNKISGENSLFQSNREDIDEMENVITDEPAKRDVNEVWTAEVITTEQDCRDEIERKTECTIEGVKNNIDSNTEKEDGINYRDQLGSSILDKEDLKEAIAQQSHSNNPEPFSAKSDIKSIYDEEENKEIEITSHNMSNVSLKVSYFEKLEQSFDKERTSRSKKDKSDKNNDSSSSCGKLELSFDETIKGEKPILISIDDKQTCSIHESTTNGLADCQELINFSESSIGVMKPVSENLKNNADSQQTLISSTVKDSVLNVQNQNVLCNSKNIDDIKQSSDGGSIIDDLINKEHGKNELTVINKSADIDNNKRFLDKSEEKSFIENKKNKNEIESSNKYIDSNKSDTGAQATAAPVAEGNELGGQNRTTSVDASNGISHNPEQCKDESLGSKGSSKTNDLSAQEHRTDNVEQNINDVSILDEINKENKLDDLNDSSNINVSKIASDNLEQSAVEPSFAENKTESDNQNGNVDVNPYISNILEEKNNPLDNNIKIIPEDNETMSEKFDQSCAKSSEVKEAYENKEVENQSGNPLVNDTTSVKLEESIDGIVKPDDRTENVELDNQNHSLEDRVESTLDRSSQSSGEIKLEENKQNRNVCDNSEEKEPDENSGLENGIDNTTETTEQNDCDGQIQNIIDSNKTDHLEQNLCKEENNETNKASCQNVSDIQSGPSQVEVNCTGTNIELEENVNLGNIYNINDIESITEVKEAYKKKEVENQGGNLVVNDSISIKIEEGIDETASPEETNEKVDLHNQNHSLEDIIEPTLDRSSQSSGEIKLEENKLNRNVFDNTDEKEPNENSGLENGIGKIAETTEQNDFDVQIQNGIDNKKTDHQEQNLCKEKNNETNKASCQSNSASQSDPSQVEVNCAGTNIELEENGNLKNVRNINKIGSIKSMSVEVEQIQDETCADGNGQIEVIFNKSVLSNDSGNLNRNTKTLSSNAEAAIKKGKVNESLSTGKNKSKGFKRSPEKNETLTKIDNSLSVIDKKSENKVGQNEKKDKNDSKIPLLDKNINEVTTLSSGSTNKLIDKKIPDSSILKSNQSELGSKGKHPVTSVETKEEKRKAIGLLEKRPANRSEVITKTISKSNEEKKVQDSKKQTETEAKKDSAVKHPSKLPIKETSVGGSKEHNLLGKRPNGKSDSVISTKKNKMNEEKQKLKANGADLKKEESKKENSDSISVVDFLDFEAEEVGKEDLPTEESSSQVDSSSDSSAKLVSDFFDCEAKEYKKECPINTVENLFNSTVVATWNESESDEGDCDWIPPSKKTNKEKTKKIQSRPVKQNVSSKIRGKQKKNLLENKISGDNATTISTKQGFFCVSNEKIPEEIKCEEHNMKSVLDTKQSTFSVTNICESTSSKTLDESTPSGFVVTGMEDVRFDQSSSTSIDQMPTETEETSLFYGTAVLPSRISKKEIQKAFEEVGVHDIVSIEYTSTNVVLLKFSKMKSLKRALKFYGQIRYKNEPIYVLAGKNCP